MKDEYKTKKQLISELIELRQQLANLENSEEEFNRLKESNDKFIKAFMHCSIPMAITTFKEGRFVDVNNSFLRFTGLRQDEIIGRTSREIGNITEEQRAVLFNELKKKGCVENLELKVAAKGGEVKDGLFNAVMMTINNEKCLLKAMVDMTERKKAEYALRESAKKYRDIWGPVDEEVCRTTINAGSIKSNEGDILGCRGAVVDLTGKKRLEMELLQIKKMEAVGNLAGGIANNFNSLFLAIQESVSLLLLDIDSSHSHYRCLKNIEAQVANGTDLTGKLLDVAGRQKYRVKPVNIDDVIEKMSSIFSGAKTNISIYQECGQELAMAAVDQERIEQVFMNLCDNARQAMPEGGKIHIKTENVLLDNSEAFPCASKERKYVKISIADTGKGIDESIKERIFDPFFTTNGREGLGLATVYGVIKGLEGMIRVYSEPGQGTTFTIYLPA